MRDLKSWWVGSQLSLHQTQARIEDADIVRLTLLLAKLDLGGHCSHAASHGAQCSIAQKRTGRTAMASQVKGSG